MTLDFGWSARSCAARQIHDGAHNHHLGQIALLLIIVGAGSSLSAGRQPPSAPPVSAGVARMYESEEDLRSRSPSAGAESKALSRSPILEILWTSGVRIESIANCIAR
jgi:hypothetical protein